MGLDNIERVDLRTMLNFSWMFVLRFETIILKSLMSRADASTRRNTAQTLANMPNHGCEGGVVDEVHIPFAFILFSYKICKL